MIDKDTAAAILAALDNLKKLVISSTVITAKTPETHALAVPLANSAPTSELGPAPKITDPNWPQAIHPQLMVSGKGDAEKQFRAFQICKLLDFDYHGAHVLDVGCGEGHVAKELGSVAGAVLGYDLKESTAWPQLSSGTVAFTTSKEEVEKHTYDAILCYDVLDHLESESIPNFVSWLRGLLTPAGKIFVRTHPWTSRHGGHLYEHGLNLAYAHLVFTPDELTSMQIEIPPVLRINRPMSVYKSAFEGAGLHVVSNRIHSEPVETFFSGSILERIIKITWGGSITPMDVMKILRNQFVDYILAIKR